MEQEIKDKIDENCPQVQWISNYAILGPYDYLDIFEAPDVLNPNRVSTIIRSFGHATTETWSATPWGQFKDMLKNLKG